MKLIKDLGMRHSSNNSKRKYRYGLYECTICKTHFETVTHRVKSGNCSKCRSCASKITNTTHGDRYTRLYKIWVGIKDRCTNENSSNYATYGAIGIDMFDMWNNYLIFKQWSELNGYAEDLTIDRIDNNRGYYPSNCRWVSSFVQARNKNPIQRNNTSGYKGAVYLKKDCKWEARIKIMGKSKYLGRFNTAKDAGIAYNKYVKANNLEHSLNIIKD